MNDDSVGHRSVRSGIFLSVTRSLWGMVTDDLRCVVLRWVQDGAVEADFVYDHPVGDREEELVSEMETEVMADWIHEVPAIRFIASYLNPNFKPVIDYPREEWVFLRREERFIVAN